MLARLTAFLIVGFARVLTGVRALWNGVAPMAEPTLYFANHTSHGDFVLVWAALPGDLRELTRPVAAADYWQGSALRRFIGAQVFRALLIDRERSGGPDPVQQMADGLHRGVPRPIEPAAARNTRDSVL